MIGRIMNEEELNEYKKRWLYFCEDNFKSFTNITEVFRNNNIPLQNFKIDIRNIIELNKPNNVKLVFLEDFKIQNNRRINPYEFNTYYKGIICNVSSGSGTKKSDTPYKYNNINVCNVNETVEVKFDYKYLNQLIIEGKIDVLIDLEKSEDNTTKSNICTWQNLI
jgi:hypothetical protein